MQIPRCNGLGARWGNLRELWENGENHFTITSLHHGPTTARTLEITVNPQPNHSILCWKSGIFATEMLEIHRLLAGFFSPTVAQTS
jgi:hypothetical protein